MRITIDTDLQAIIVPESYYMQDYSQYIKNCFDKAYATQIVRQNDVAKMKGTKKRKATAKTAEGAPEGKSEEKPAEEAKQ